MKIASKKLQMSLCTALFCLSMHFQTAKSQGLAADDEVRAVINTAGYSAVFGAAMGAALLPFIPDPGLSSLRYIAGGASIGFFVGSGVALYRLSNPDGNLNNSHVEPNDGDFVEDNGYSNNEIQKLKFEISQTTKAEREAVPQGSLLVGNKSNVAISMPAFAVGKNFGLIRLLDYRF
jgi:hypothetical protein